MRNIAADFGHGPNVSLYAPEPFSTVPDEADPWGHESIDIAMTLDAIRPHLKRGVSHYKLGSVCGAAASDVLRFVAGTASLTAACRARLREWARGEAS